MMSRNGVTNEVKILKNVPFYITFKFFFLIISLQYIQKYITAVGSKLLWHQKWYIIHVWRNQMLPYAYMMSLHFEITLKNQNVQYILRNVNKQLSKRKKKIVFY